MNKCKNCRIKFPYRINNGLVGGFCSNDCEQEYNEKMLPWQKKNRDKYNKYMKEYYKNNKKKNNSRCLTYQLLCPVSLSCDIDIDRSCKNCNLMTDLEIHHEEYPDNIKEIIESISNGKIYFVCKMCHNKITTKNRKIYKG